MDEQEKQLPETEEDTRSEWQKTKEGWYDKVPLTKKQLDYIVWACYIALAVVFIKIFIDAGIFG